MGLQERIAALRQRHAALDDQIHEESTRPHPDDERIAELKREKLRIKDEMERVSQQAEA